MNAALLAAAPHAFGPWSHGGFGPGPGFLFFLVPLFWLVVIVVIGSVFGRRWRRAAMSRGYGPGGFGGFGGFGGGQFGGPVAAEQTLSERFARGDIDEVEYRARLEVLRANRS
jgi:putative membrane protein